MVIKVINLKSTLDKFGKVSDIDIMPEIKEATYKVKRAAKDLVPVDTGALKGSIRHKLFSKEQTGVIYTTLEYAPHQEFGTRYMPAQPFMRPAMNMHRAGIQQSLKKFMREEIAKKV
jgi:HK97 gp10 family phage protein